jgi:glycosyltransferase involved in cell wall biosynthesis
MGECFRRYNSDVTVIWTATPKPAQRAVPRPDQRRPILAWAHSVSLQYPMEAQLVHSIVLELAKRLKFEFWLYGTRPDQAADYFAPLSAAGVACRAIDSLPYDAFLRSLWPVAVGIQPVCLDNPFSRGKSFGKILAYLAGDVATVASNCVDHPLFFRHGDNGYLVDQLPEWIESIQALLEKPQLRQRVSESAYQDFCRQLTTEATCHQVDTVLRRAAGIASR